MRTFTLAVAAGLSVGVCYAQPDPQGLADCKMLFDNNNINALRASNEFDRAYADCATDGKSFACARALSLGQRTMRYLPSNSTAWGNSCDQLGSVCKDFTATYQQTLRSMTTAYAAANKQCPAGDAKCADSLQTAVHSIRDVVFLSSKGSLVCASVFAADCTKALEAGNPVLTSKLHPAVEAAVASCSAPPKSDCNDKLQAVSDAAKALDPYAKTVSSACGQLPSRDCKVDEDYENTLGAIFTNLKKAYSHLSAGHYPDLQEDVLSMQASSNLLVQYTKDGPVDCHFPSKLLQ